MQLVVSVMSVNRARMCGHSEQIDEADQEGKFYHAFEIHARFLSTLLDKKDVMCLGSLLSRLGRLASLS